MLYDHPSTPNFSVIPKLIYRLKLDVKLTTCYCGVQCILYVIGETCLFVFVVVTWFPNCFSFFCNFYIEIYNSKKIHQILSNFIPSVIIVVLRNVEVVYIAIQTLFICLACDFILLYSIHWNTPGIVHYRQPWHCTSLAPMTLLYIIDTCDTVYYSQPWHHLIVSTPLLSSPWFRMDSDGVGDVSNPAWMPWNNFIFIENLL
jgi:hypothetical protein